MFKSLNNNEHKRKVPRMSQRDRPKLANYVQRHEQKAALVSSHAAAVTEQLKRSLSSNALSTSDDSARKSTNNNIKPREGGKGTTNSSAKPSSNPSNSGKVMQYKNLDDIPDVISNDDYWQLSPSKISQSFSSNSNSSNKAVNAASTTTSSAPANTSNGVTSMRPMPTSFPASSVASAPATLTSKVISGSDRYLKNIPVVSSVEDSYQMLSARQAHAQASYGQQQTQVDDDDDEYYSPVNSYSNDAYKASANKPKAAVAQTQNTRPAPATYSRTSHPPKHDDDSDSGVYEEDDNLDDDYDEIPRQRQQQQQKSGKPTKGLSKSSATTSTAAAKPVTKSTPASSKPNPTMTGNNISPISNYNGNNQAVAYSSNLPSFPYEATAKKEAATSASTVVTEKDKLFFSREPRKVEYK